MRLCLRPQWSSKWLSGRSDFGSPPFSLAARNSPSAHLPDSRLPDLNILAHEITHSFRQASDPQRWFVWKTASSKLDSTKTTFEFLEVSRSTLVRFFSQSAWERSARSMRMDQFRWKLVLGQTSFAPFIACELKVAGMSQFAARGHEASRSPIQWTGIHRISSAPNQVNLSIGSPTTGPS